MVPAGSGRTGPQGWDSAALGHIGALNQGTRDTGVGSGMEGGARHQKLTVGRVKGGSGLVVGGLLMGNEFAVKKGASPHSGLGSGGVAFPAEHVAIQGEAAVVVRLNGQWLPTVLGEGKRAHWRGGPLSTPPPLFK